MELEGPSSSSDVPRDLKFAISAGGAYCDYCQKSREQASVVNFSKCKSCRMAYYCDESCQFKAWERGHNHHCKKFGCFAVGDKIVLEDGIYLSGGLASVINIVPGGKEMMIGINCNSPNESINIVKTKHVRHIRPLH